MKQDNVFVIVDGQRTRYNKYLKHTTIKFDLNDPAEFREAKRLAFEIMEQINTYLDVYCEEEEGEE